MKLTHLLKILTLVFIVTISTEVKAQDPAFTQFYANPIYLNQRSLVHMVVQGSI